MEHTRDGRETTGLKGSEESSGGYQRGQIPTGADGRSDQGPEANNGTQDSPSAPAIAGKSPGDFKEGVSPHEGRKYEPHLNFAKPEVRLHGGCCLGNRHPLHVGDHGQYDRKEDDTVADSSRAGGGHYGVWFGLKWHLVEAHFRRSY